MKAIIETPILDKSDMWLLGFDDKIYHIAEGTGDALTQDDINAGYVDYIYIDVYLNNLTDIYNNDTWDGGFILLTEPYKDMSVVEIIDKVEKFYDIMFKIEI